MGAATTSYFKRILQNILSNVTHLPSHHQTGDPMINIYQHYLLITNLMLWLLFIHKIIFSSTCFEPQVLIFRRIQLYTCSIWYWHSLWEFLVACQYTAWVRTDCGRRMVGRLKTPYLCHAYTVPVFSISTCLEDISYPRRFPAAVLR